MRKLVLKKSLPLAAPQAGGAGRPRWRWRRRRCGKAARSQLTRQRRLAARTVQFTSSARLDRVVSVQFSFGASPSARPVVVVVVVEPNQQHNTVAAAARRSPSHSSPVQSVSQPAEPVGRLKSQVASV